MHLRALTLSALVTLAAIPAIARAQDNKNLPPAAAAAIDSTVVTTLDSGRAAVKAHPGGVYEAQVFAQQADNAFVSGTAARGKIDGNALVAEASGYIDAALKGATPDQSARLFAVKAVLLRDAGRLDDARAAAKQAEDTYAAAHGAKAAPPPPAAAPATPTSVSVRFVSNCPKTVSVGTGATPDDSTPADLASAADDTRSLAPGDVVWLFDKNGRTISHARIRAATKTVTVGKSCKSVVVR